MKKPDIDKLYKQYQTTRIPEENIRDVIARAHRKGKGERSNKSSNDQISKDDMEPVTNLFRNWQRQRNPNREEQIANILAEARKRNERRRQQRDSTVTNPSRQGRLFLNYLQEMFRGISSSPGWQMAIPALILIVVFTITLPQLEWQENKGGNFVQNGIPAALVARADRAAAQIQTSAPPAGFGFSGDSAADPVSTAFQLGVLVTDLHLLVAAGEDEKGILVAQRIRQILQQPERDISRHPVKPVTISHPEQLMQQLDQLYSNHPQEAMFRFGKWLESSLLTTGIMQEEILPDDRQLLKTLLEQGRKVGSNSALQIPSDINRLMSRLHERTESTEPSPEGIRSLHRLLMQIKAALL